MDLCRLLFILILGLLDGRISAARGKCRIRCGVVIDRRGTSSLQAFVTSVWENLRYTKALNNVEMNFVRIKNRIDMTMDELIEAYMEIGTTNVSALIGPYLQPVATATEKFGIPYLLTTDVDDGRYAPYNLISVFPKPSDLYSIAVDVVRRYDWRDVAVFYESIEGVRLLEELVRYPKVNVRAWKIDNTVGHQRLREFLLSVRQNGMTNIIVLSSTTVSTKLLEQALHLSMLSHSYSWILPSLTQGASNHLNEYAYTQVNLTTFDMEQHPLPKDGPGDGYFTQFEYATIYDSLLTLYHGVRGHHRNTGNCQWAGKTRLLPELARITSSGATGEISFRRDGSRKGYVVNVLSLTDEGLEKIGFWNSSVSDTTKRLFINTSRPLPPIKNLYPLGKELVRVVTILENPFVRLKNDYRHRKGNDRFEGYCIDLLREVAEMLDFRYEIYIVPDQQFGTKNKDGLTWNGLVGQLMNGNASLAVASLTITSAREQVIDFSKPFTSLGISIVMSKPEEERTLFQFLNPLSPIVWLLLLAVFLLISGVLYLIDKITPSEDSNIQFGVQDSVWFTFASLVLCGTDTIPRTISGRVLAGSLWFFALFMLSSYTANLAAFLTVSRFTQNIRGIADLVDQSTVKYGTVKNSDVSTFFENSQLHHFQKMWQYMSSVEPTNMVRSSDEGFNKVKTSSGGYAFLWDSPVIKYKVDTDCTLMEIGQPFDSKGYGIGVPLGARYRDDLSMTILKLGEKGRLEALKHKWWKSGNCPHPEKPTTSSTTSLGVERVGGIFIILGVGLVLSLVACVCDYYYRLKLKDKKAKNRKVLEKKSGNNVLDGGLACTTEEPFLSNCNSTTTCNEYTAPCKQTNIF